MSSWTVKGSYTRPARGGTSPNTTSLALDQYVGNNDGVLDPDEEEREEEASTSRKPASISRAGGVALEARCYARNGALDDTTLNLDNWVDNTNGFLVWVG